MDQSAANGGTTESNSAQSNGNGGQVFAIDRRYRVVRELGQGAYGLVVAAKDKETGEAVAIKKVTRVFDKLILAKRALREIKLMQHFNGHENVVALIDVEILDPVHFNEIYFVEELMEADLYQIIRSGQSLTDSHFQYFMYQILRGLKYIHSANVLHRDLKPGNLLVNADCELKICDFGLARGYDDNPEENAGFMTEYVATRWYRAPEIMLSFRSYTKAIDIWSVGCIFAEMLGGKPLFKGRDYVDQLNQILAVLGTPDEQTLQRIGSERAQVYIRSLRHMPKIPFSQLYPNAPPMALDLLDKLLQFDPAKRPTVEEALSHSYMATYHDETDEVNCGRIFDFSFESANDIDTIRRMISQEIQAFKAESLSADMMTDVTTQDTAVSDMDTQQPQMLVAQQVAASNTGTNPQQSGIAGVVDQQLERELQGGAMSTTMGTMNGYR